VLAVRGDPDGRRSVFLRGGTEIPDVGKPFVIAATEKFDGVLGIVSTAGRHRSGAVKVTVRPAALDQAYAKLDIRLRNAELDELDASASSVLSREFRCTGSRDSRFDVDPDFSGLRPRFELNIRRRELLFQLAGTARFDVGLEVTADASCKYVGKDQIDIPIASTPVVVTLKPAFSAGATGKIETGFGWEPGLRVGVQRKRGRSRPFHDIYPNLGSVNVLPSHGNAQAELFLGLNVGVSVAGRVGIEGEMGPKVTADAEIRNGEACIDADGSIHAGLTAYVDVFVKSWNYKLATADFGKRSLFTRCFPSSA